MSDKQKQELQEKGFAIISTWHIVFMIVFMIAGIGVVWGITQNRLDNVENRTEQLEDFRAKQEIKNTITGEKRDRQFHEIQMNMKMLIERQGLKYQRVED